MFRAIRLGIFRGPGYQVCNSGFAFIFQLDVNFRNPGSKERGRGPEKRPQNTRIPVSGSPQKDPNFGNPQVGRKIQGLEAPGKPRELLQPLLDLGSRV